MPSARCCGCSTATATRRSRHIPRSTAPQMTLTASVLDEDGSRVHRGRAHRARRTGRANSAALVGLELLQRGRGRDHRADAADRLSRVRGLHASTITAALQLSAALAHPAQHLLDMRDRGFRLDAVAEIEDQPPVARNSPARRRRRGRAPRRRRSAPADRDCPARRRGSGRARGSTTARPPSRC